MRECSCFDRICSRQADSLRAGSSQGINIQMEKMKTSESQCEHIDQFIIPPGSWKYYVLLMYNVEDIRNVHMSLRYLLVYLYLPTNIYMYNVYYIGVFMFF